MKIILLPGFSERNREWAEQTKSELFELGLKLELLEWDHWETNSESFSIKKEKEKLLKVIQSEEEYIILAKSVGTRLAANMIRDKHINPKKIILMGVPSTNKVYKEAFESFPGNKVKVIQNTNDPFESFKDIEKFFKKVNPKIEVIEVEESSHNYPYSDLFATLINS